MWTIEEEQRIFKLNHLGQLNWLLGMEFVQTVPIPDTALMV